MGGLQCCRVRCKVNADHRPHEQRPIMLCYNYVEDWDWKRSLQSHFHCPRRMMYVNVQVIAPARPKAPLSGGGGGGGCLVVVVAVRTVGGEWEVQVNVNTNT